MAFFMQIMVSEHQETTGTLAPYHMYVWIVANHLNQCIDQIWDNYFKACEHTGKELLRAGAVGMPDLETWRNSKNKIINIGIPAYSFLECFLHSIKSGSPGFLMRMDNCLLPHFFNILFQRTYKSVICLIKNGECMLS